MGISFSGLPHEPQELGGRGSSGKVHSSPQPQCLGMLMDPKEDIKIIKPWHLHSFLIISQYLEPWNFDGSSRIIPNILKVVSQSADFFMSTCYVEARLKTKPRANVNSETVLNLLACFSWLLKIVPDELPWLQFFYPLNVHVIHDYHLHSFTFIYNLVGVDHVQHPLPYHYPTIAQMFG